MTKIERYDQWAGGMELEKYGQWVQWEDANELIGQVTDRDIVIEQYKSLLRRYQSDHNRACAAMERDCECQMCLEAERITT